MGQEAGGITSIFHVKSGISARTTDGIFATFSHPQARLITHPVLSPPSPPDLQGWPYNPAKHLFSFAPTRVSFTTLPVGASGWAPQSRAEYTSPFQAFGLATGLITPLQKVAPLFCPLGYFCPFPPIHIVSYC